MLKHKMADLSCLCLAFSGQILNGARNRGIISSVWLVVLVFWGVFLEQEETAGRSLLRHAFVFAKEKKKRHLRMNCTCGAPCSLLPPQERALSHGKLLKWPHISSDIKVDFNETKLLS